MIQVVSLIVIIIFCLTVVYLVRVSVYSQLLYLNSITIEEEI